MISYTTAQMLAIWRSHLALDTAYADCSVEQFDGLNVNDLIARRMRQWYLHLLDTAPAALLPTADIAARCTRTARPDNVANLLLPADCRRLVQVRCASWPTPVQPTADTAALRLLGHPFAAPTARRPMAITSHNALTLAPCAPADAIELIAVIDPGPDTYTLDESLLATIPTTI